MSAVPDVAEQLSGWASSVEAHLLPDGVRFAAAADLLDTLGCAIAGHAAEGVVEVRRRTSAWSTDECTSWGTAVRLSPPEAALVNATAAHAMEFDDTHDDAVVHSGAAVCAAAIATAEALPGVDGATLIAAIVAGTEVACRLAEAVRTGPGTSGWLLTPLVGYFGAAAAAGRVLGLDAIQMRHALGIAYAQTAGNGQATLDGALTKRLQPGFAARGGVLAAWLAADGMTGARDVFEGPRGFYPVYHGNDYDAERILRDLGRRFAVTELAFKPYPCCRWTHAAVEGACDLHRRGIDVAVIERVSVEVNDQALRSTGFPVAHRQNPQTPHDAQFSLPYTVAVALSTGTVELDDFEPDAVTNSSVLRLARRIEPQPWVGPPIGSDRGISGARVTVHFRDGTSTGVSTEQPRALRPHPDDLGLLLGKFATCCNYVNHQNADQAAKEIVNVGVAEDVGYIGRLMERSHSGCP